MWYTTLIKYSIKEYDHINRWSKAFDKLQHPFMIESLSKVGIEGKYLNTGKGRYDKCSGNTFKDEN